MDAAALQCAPTHITRPHTFPRKRKREPPLARAILTHVLPKITAHVRAMMPQHERQRPSRECCHRVDRAFPCSHTGSTLEPPHRMHHRRLTTVHDSRSEHAEQEVTKHAVQSLANRISRLCPKILRFTTRTRGFQKAGQRPKAFRFEYVSSTFRVRPTAPSGHVLPPVTEPVRVMAR